MQVWCFVGANGLWALSGEQAGASLPEDLGPWTFLKLATLDGAEKDEQEAKALIAEHGYCCFNPAMTD
jgi:hypothetical protein